MFMNITQSDIKHLVQDPSATVRADITQKICGGFSRDEFQERERQLAVEIMRLLLRDTAVRVRKVMADELCNHAGVPRDIVLSLANDHEDVAEHILKHSPVLSEDDLIAIVESTYNLKKLTFIAKRNSISAGLSHALVHHSDPTITRTLLGNKGASVNESTLDFLLEEYSHDQSILEAMVHRGGLPHRYAEQLFSMVSNHLKKDLTKRYRLSRHLVDDITENAREVAVMEFLSPWMSESDIKDLVNQMYRSKRLSESVIIRGLCAGNIRFFEMAMARRADVTIDNARMLLMDAGQRGFSALYDAANMPDNFREAIRVLYKFAQSETNFGQYHHARFSDRMIERIVAEGADSRIDNMPYLMSIIGRSMQDVPTLH